MRKMMFLCALALSVNAWANIDMQAHVMSDEGKAAYSEYLTKQAAYYIGDYSDSALHTLSGDELFGRLNAIIGSTSLIEGSGFTYNSLRNQYVNVDRDLNTAGNIIGFYDGQSMDGAWDGGNTYNREHTWPQSKGADKSIAMGHDMQSVRPASTSVNSGRGNDAYGESVYDPDTDVSIDNDDYKPINLGSYRGDCARVILYDYLTYGEAGGYKSSLYNGNAQLLSKLSTSGVFESLHTLLKWHMQDPPSLTEMVRNDGAQDYQSNRNPAIDFPELMIEIFLENEDIEPYTVTYTTDAAVSPRYIHTLDAGFICYLTHEDGTHPDSVVVKGGTGSYDKTLGRLIVTNVSSNMYVIEMQTPTDLQNTEALYAQPKKVLRDGQIRIVRKGEEFTMIGQKVQ